MVPAKSDVYKDNMGRNATESQRLDQQLELINQNIGYLLHPSITSKLSPSALIADVGTGTGSFLTLLAKEYPGATLRGFDISQDLFPAPESLPANVELGIMDVKKPPPLEERHRYDVVHARLLTAAMDPEDWAKTVRHLVGLLKLGGALQWEECNFLHSRHLRGQMDSSTSTARFMGRLFREALKERIPHGWSTLPQIMSDSGLVEVDEDVVSSDRVVESREALTSNGMAAMFGMARLMCERGSPGALSMEKLRSLEEKAEEDIRSGCYVRFDIHIALGFKHE